MFEVRWVDAATNELAEIWIRSSDRKAINDAANVIDRLLRSDPQDVGESRDDSERIAFVPPLVVRFQVSEDDRLVLVLDVVHIRQRNQE